MIEQDDPRSYHAILKNNTELAARVEQMKAEDQEVLKDFEKLLAEARDLRATMGDRPMDEKAFEPRRDSMVEQGLAFILRARKQRVAVSTWMSESLRRETGAGD
jgi:hypothetical protein